MKLYLSGPMTGYPEWNYPAFHMVANHLRGLGYEVFNPAEAFEGDTTLDWSEYLRADIRALLDCDEVVVLAGWERSTGARLEVIIALSLGLRVRDLKGEPIFKSGSREEVSQLLGIFDLDEEVTILEEAHSLVHGDRQSDYGHPYFDFRRTALIWTGLFIDRLKPGEKFTARDVPLAMQGVKLSREVNRPKRDNRVDGAGYWETLQLVHDFESSVTEEAL